MTPDKRLFAVVGIVFILFSSTVSSDNKTVAPEFIEGAVIVSAEELIKLVYSNADLLIVDSRKQSEFLKGHIEGAVNIVDTEITRELLQGKLSSQSTAVLFYCNGPRCMRSSNSIEKALAWGYRNIFWFRGGWQEWSSKKLPVVLGDQ